MTYVGRDIEIQCTQRWCIAVKRTSACWESSKQMLSNRSQMSDTFQKAEAFDALYSNDLVVCRSPFLFVLA